jgi:hypothetical protein
MTEEAVPMVEIKVETTCGTRKRCLGCDGWTNKDSVQAFVYRDGERTGFVICEACLQLPYEEYLEKSQEVETERYVRLIELGSGALRAHPSFREFRRRWVFESAVNQIDVF